MTSENRTEIPFSMPVSQKEGLENIQIACETNKLTGRKFFGSACEKFIKEFVGAQSAHLMPSCTAALEASSILANVDSGAEVIVPSHTFVSSASSFAMRGCTPVFVDCDPQTLNVSAKTIEPAITKATRCVVVVHYAGIACDMDPIVELCQSNGLVLIEDAAQAIGAYYKSKHLGTIGDLGTFSFHHTKNVGCGEGGALIVNSDDMVHLAEMICEKGTDRAKFVRGEVDKYTWQTLGSSYLLGELSAAFLLPQLKIVERITAKRLRLWHRYFELLKPAEDNGLLTRPIVPEYCKHNGHIFYVLLNPRFPRDDVILKLKNFGIHATSHYIPLHSSPAGRALGRVGTDMIITEDVTQRLVRLPLFFDLSLEQVEFVVDKLIESLV